MAGKILFISHDATRTGAPIVFLHQLEWLRRNSNFEMHFLLLDGGPLLEKFERLGKVYLWKTKLQPANVFQRGVNKVSRLIKPQKSYQEKLIKLLDQVGFELIYSNTVASHLVAADLKKKLNIPWISHIHEMPYSIDAFYKKAMAKEILDLIDVKIVVSKATRNLLLQNYPIQANRLKLIYECVPLGISEKATDSIEDIKKGWGSQDDFIVGGSGVMSWRKGIDLFINISRIIESKPEGKKIKFVWVGELKNEVVQGYYYECQRLGVKPSIVFTGSTAQPLKYFQAFDIFILTSREDPFPLVCLEAATIGKPVLCFEESGGIPELIENGGGSIIPYLDVEAFSNEILKYASNSTLCEESGEKVRLAVSNYDVEAVAPSILTLIQETIVA